MIALRKANPAAIYSRRFIGEAAGPLEALCWLNGQQGGTIHDFCRKYGYDFTRHVGEAVRVVEDAHGRYATFETTDKTKVIVSDDYPRNQPRRK